MRISDWSSDVCSSDLLGMTAGGLVEVTRQRAGQPLAALLMRPPERAPRADPMAQACAALRLSLRELGSGTPVLVAAPDVVAALEGPLAAALAETGRRLGQPLEIGRASCRERECQYV